MGPAGPVGIDYSVVATVFQLEGIERKQWKETFACIRVMEREALETMREGVSK